MLVENTFQSRVLAVIIADGCQVFANVFSTNIFSFFGGTHSHNNDVDELSWFAMFVHYVLLQICRYSIFCFE